MLKVEVTTQARKYFTAIQKLDIGEPLYWNEADCKRRGYTNALAGVVLEGTGLGAIDETTVETDFGTLKLEGMSRVKGVLVEPFASYLMLFYQD